MKIGRSARDERRSHKLHWDTIGFTEQRISPPNGRVVGKACVFMSLSLDGYFEGPDHDISWHHVDDEFNAFVIDLLKDSGLFVMGRRNYQLMESYWPGEEDNPESSPSDLVVARLLNHTPKVVYSKTLDRVTEQKNWTNVRLVREVDPEQVRRWKREISGPIWVGGSNIATSFIREGLIDEFHFTVVPVMIGAGTKIFDGLGSPLRLELIDQRRFRSGNVLLSYKPKKS